MASPVHTLSMRQALPPLGESPDQDLAACEALLPREETMLALAFPLRGLVF